MKEKALCSPDLLGGLSFHAVPEGFHGCSRTGGGEDPWPCMGSVVPMASQSHLLPVGLAGPATLALQSSPLSREGWLAQDTVFWKHCLYSAKCQPSQAQSWPGPVPSPAQGFPYPPVMTLTVSLPLCQPIQQRCLLVAIQSAHTPLRSTPDKGKHLTKLPRGVRNWCPV